MLFTSFYHNLAPWCTTGALSSFRISAVKPQPLPSNPLPFYEVTATAKLVSAGRSVHFKETHFLQYVFLFSLEVTVRYIRHENQIEGFVYREGGLEFLSSI
jgi:hypothetical protein